MPGRRPWPTRSRLCSAVAVVHYGRHPHRDNGPSPRPSLCRISTPPMARRPPARGTRRSRWIAVRTSAISPSPRLGITSRTVEPTSLPCADPQSPSETDRRPARPDRTSRTAGDRSSPPPNSAFPSPETRPRAPLTASLRTDSRATDQRECPRPPPRTITPVAIHTSIFYPISTPAMPPWTIALQPPPSWQQFEDLCHHLFKAVWRDPYAQKVGRPGQPQHGVDIFGSPGATYEAFHGVQCKFKSTSSRKKLTVHDLQIELSKADHFRPSLQHWICATTSPTDAALQQTARQLSVTRTKQRKFPLSVLGWEEVVSLLTQHDDIVARFYPAHAFDIPKLIASSQSVTASVRDLRDLIERTITRPSSVVDGAPHVWQRVSFGANRDLRPALLGRRLGPHDAPICPPLYESSVAIRELTQAYSARIVGQPGTGKSLCAYQAALHFAKKGWSVYRLIDPSVQAIEFDQPDVDSPAMFVIDDAHLANSGVLRAAEDAAGPRRLLLSTHNAVEHDSSSRGAITIDSKRAVSTIASALLRDATRTMDVVRSIDDQVGDLPYEVSLEDRIVHAEQESQFPWQFCFILGGGWRRATTVVDAARSKNADITLAAVCICQLASRDARPTRSELTALLHTIGVRPLEVNTSLEWLLEERILIGDEDLRCPHQRYASTLLAGILARQSTDGRSQIGSMLGRTISTPDYPISGIRVLLFEISYGAKSQPWTHLVPEGSLNALLRRCWTASSPQDRAFASLILSEVGRHLPGWPQQTLRGHHDLLGHWISQPAEPSGYGLARLIHAVYNTDREYARTLAEAAEPRALAIAVSAATCPTAYNLGELVSALHYWAYTHWGTDFSSRLDRSALVRLSANWPESEPLWAFANFCVAIGRFDEPLGLDMLDSFLPIAQRLLSRDPVSAFGDLHDILLFLLRMIDYFGTYVGHRAPTVRHRSLASKLLESVHISSIAVQLSSIRLRDFRTTGLLLAFIARAEPPKFRAIVTAMDWRRIAESIGEQWTDLPRDAEILLEIAYSVTACSDTIVNLIHDYSCRIDEFPPSLAVIAPRAAFNHAKNGGVIRLSKHGHVDWHYGAEVIRCFAETRHDLLEDVLRTSDATTARVFSEPHPSFYEKAEDYVELLKSVSPRSLQRILDGVDVDKASEGWTAALRNGKSPRRTAALLVEASVDRADELGIMARRLRARFPSSSVPTHP